MDLECGNCKQLYTLDECPSDYFCSKYCQDVWTHRQSAEVTQYDEELDAEARRIRGGGEEPEEDEHMAVVTFTGRMIFLANNSRQPVDIMQEMINRRAD